MKRNLFTFSFLIATALFASCEKDQTPKLTPAEPGQITMDRTKVGAGQPVTLTCPISLGENVKSYEVRWKYPSGISSEPVQLEDGKAILKDYTPSSAGHYILACTVSSQGDGGFENKEATIEFDVINCDFKTSFWGDNLNDTKRYVPGIQKLEGQSDVYFLISKDANKNQIFTYYVFSNDKLSKGLESLIADNLRPIRNRVEASTLPVTGSYGLSFSSIWKDETSKTTQQEAILDKIMADPSLKSIKNYEEIDILSEPILKGDLTMEFTCSNGSTNSVLTIEKQKDADKIAFQTVFKP